jgi:hypothetical protein
MGKGIAFNTMAAGNTGWVWAAPKNIRSKIAKGQNLRGFNNCKIAASRCNRENLPPIKSVIMGIAAGINGLYLFLSEEYLPEEKVFFTEYSYTAFCLLNIKAPVLVHGRTGTSWYIFKYKRTVIAGASLSVN